MSVVSEKNGKRLFRHRKQLFGASGGLVRIFDERDGTQASCDPVEFLLRAEALGLEADRCVFPSERTELENAANEMELAAADAAAQGSPLDPKVQAYHARHGQNNRVLVGAGTAALAGDAGPKLWVPPGT